MKFDTAANTIRNAISAVLESAFSSSTIKWPNAPFTPPTDGSLWAVVHLMWGNTNQATVGAPNANYYRTVGVLEVWAYDSAEKGEHDSLTALDTVADTIRNLGVSIIGPPAGRVRLLVPSIASRGLQDEGWLTVLSCPFEIDFVN